MIIVTNLALLGRRLELGIRRRLARMISEEEICSDLMEVRMNMFSSEPFTIHIFRNTLIVTKLPVSSERKHLQKNCFDIQKVGDFTDLLI